MIKILGFYKRRADLTHEQFSQHWRTIHGPMIARIPDADRYLKRYVQHHVTDDPRGPGDTPFDGFSEAWFDSLEERDIFVALPEILEQVVPDEDNFLDLEATRWMVVDEQVVQIGTVTDDTLAL